MGDSHARLTEALASAVEEMGRRVADRPDRLRAVLLDELGAHAREHRAGVEALVAAAEANVPSALARRRRGQEAPDDAELSQLITARDVAPEEASYALGAWTTALRADTPSVLPEASSGPMGAPGGAPAGSGAPLTPITVGVSEMFGPGASSWSEPAASSAQAADAPTRLASGSAPTSADATRAAAMPVAGPGQSPPPPGAPRLIRPDRADQPDRSDRQGGLVLRGWSVVALVLIAMIVAGGGVWLVRPRSDTTGTVSAQTSGMPGMSGAGSSSGASAAASSGTVTAASTTTTPAPTSSAPTSSAPATPVPLTVSDTTDPDFTPVLTDAAANTWQVQPVTFTSTGTYDKIEVVSQLEKHGLVNVGPDGMVDGTTLTYEPKHNGDFWDHVTIRLHDTATGAVSNEATITLHALCAPNLACHNMAPGQVMK